MSKKQSLSPRASFHAEPPHDCHPLSLGSALRRLRSREREGRSDFTAPELGFLLCVMQPAHLVGRDRCPISLPLTLKLPLSPLTPSTPNPHAHPASQGPVPSFGTLALLLLAHLPEILIPTCSSAGAICFLGQVPVEEMRWRWLRVAGPVRDKNGGGGGVFIYLAIHSFICAFSPAFVFCVRQILLLGPRVN